MLLQVGCPADLVGERYELVSQLVVHTASTFRKMIPAPPTLISARTVVVLAALKPVACLGSLAFACRWGHFSAGDASASQKLVNARAVTASERKPRDYDTGAWICQIKSGRNGALASLEILGQLGTQ